MAIMADFTYACMAQDILEDRPWRPQNLSNDPNDRFDYKLLLEYLVGNPARTILAYIAGMERILKKKEVPSRRVAVTKREKKCEICRKNKPDQVVQMKPRYGSFKYLR